MIIRNHQLENNKVIVKYLNKDHFSIIGTVVRKLHIRMSLLSNFRNLEDNSRRDPLESIASSFSPIVDGEVANPKFHSLTVNMTDAETGEPISGGALYTEETDKNLDPFLEQNCLFYCTSEFPSHDMISYEVREDTNGLKPEYVIWFDDKYIQSYFQLLLEGAAQELNVGLLESRWDRVFYSDSYRPRSPFVKSLSHAVDNEMRFLVYSENAFELEDGYLDFWVRMPDYVYVAKVLEKNQLELI